jgi:RNA polymerase sigma-70 factor (sigma-E family)
MTGGRDDEEYLAWVAGCQQRLLGSAYLLSGDLQRAEDLVQEALVKVALRWSRLRDGNPTAYARTIIARDHVSWWRRLRREALTEVPESAAVPPATEDRLVVLRALGRLTRAQRSVVVLRYFDDLTERETAEVLGVSIGTVKSQHSAALARLRTGAPELLDLIEEKP